MNSAVSRAFHNDAKKQNKKTRQIAKHAPAPKPTPPTADVASCAEKPDDSQYRKHRDPMRPRSRSGPAPRTCSAWVAAPPAAVLPAAVAAAAAASAGPCTGCTPAGAGAAGTARGGRTGTLTAGAGTAGSPTGGTRGCTRTGAGRGCPGAGRTRAGTRRRRRCRRASRRSWRGRCPGGR